MTVEGLNGDFLNRVNTLIAAANAAGFKIKVGNGFRTRAQQEALYKQKPNLAAPPGRSNHEKGMAADLVYGPGAQEWAIANAGKFGLRFPMLSKQKGKKYEPWHIEPANMKVNAGGGYTPPHNDDDDHNHGAEVAAPPVDVNRERFSIEYQLQSLGQLLMAGEPEAP